MSEAAVERLRDYVRMHELALNDEISPGRRASIQAAIDTLESSIRELKELQEAQQPPS